MMLRKDDQARLLNKFVTEEIALNQEDISSAVRSKAWLLDQISAKIADKVGHPELYVEDPFIGYGSYFAYLKVTDVDEMDFLVVIDSNSGVFTQNGVQYGVGLGTASPNHKYDTRFKKADLSGVSPAKLLLWLKDICWEVLKPLGGDEPVIDGPAVKVVLKSKGIKFDLVPAGAFERTDGSGHLFYNIPKGDITDGWVLTNPKKDIERVEKLAQVCDGFRNVVRLVKFIRDSYGIPISSYAIQCAVCQFAEEYMWQADLFTNFQHALTTLKRRLESGLIEDGFDTSKNLLEGVGNSAQGAITVQAVNERLQSLTSEANEEAAYDKLCQILKNSAEASRVRKLGLTSDFEAIARLLYPNTQKKRP